MASMPPFTRAQKVTLVVSGAALVVLVAVLALVVYPWARWTEDFFPGSAPDEVLRADAWEVSDEAVSFAVIGDNGSGGRNAMDVARQMARTYQDTPYGVVVLLGDISYYGSILNRYEDVFVRPFRPLLDANVEFELAIGNHEIQENPSPEELREVADKLRALGLDNTYYKATHGPVDLFVLDSSLPLAGLASGDDQLAWLDRELAASEAAWQVVALHHPLYSSAEKRRPDPRLREALEPALIEHGVDIVFTGHEHFYERTHPQQGVTHIVSGAGSKLSSVGTSDFTAVSEEKLHFMHVEVQGDRMTVRAIDQRGEVIDQFTLRAR